MTTNNEGVRVRFVYFAGCREAVGKTSEEALLPAEATVADALAWLSENYPPLARIVSTVRVALNQEFVAMDARVADGDEIVLIPPISGGSGARALLSHEAVDRHAAETLIQTSAAGAIASFAGVVRPTSKQGRDVTDLFYEAYEPMAVAKLEQCLSEAAERWSILDAAVVHRLGALGLGDVAVSIAVASKHRKEAFAACAYVIDRIKEIVPIWKKETGPDGSEWVSEGA